MKRSSLIVTACGLLAAIGGIGYHVVEQRLVGRCGQWMNSAERAAQQGYSADVLAVLRPYFAQKRCRGVTDSRAQRLLVDARIRVPLPGGEHRQQYYGLIRSYGLRADSRIDAYPLAQAYMVAGRWRDAWRWAGRSTNPRAELVRIAAARALNDPYLIHKAKTALMRAPLHPFDHAVAALSYPTLRGARPDIVQALQAATGARRTASRDGALLERAADWSADVRLRLANYLMAAGRSDLAKTILAADAGRHQPSAVRLMTLYWQDGAVSSVLALADRLQTTSLLPAEAQFLLCVSAIEQQQVCTVDINRRRLARQRGDYYAHHWNDLLLMLAGGTDRPAAILDQMASMDELLQDLPSAHWLKARLYQGLGETAHAARSAAYAMRLGLAEGRFDRTMTAPTLNCARGEHECWQQVTADGAHHPRLWSAAMRSGHFPEGAALAELRAHSPDDGSIWRLAEARLLLNAGSDAEVARAIRHLDTVLVHSPVDYQANIMMMQSVLYFRDIDAARLASLRAARAAPERVPELLRAALWTYGQDMLASPKALTSWWRQLTIAESAARGLDPAGVDYSRLSEERLALLAAYGEYSEDDALRREVYEELLILRPDHLAALNNLAAIALKGQQLRRAEALIARALKVAPDYPAVLDTADQIKHARLEADAAARDKRDKARKDQTK